MTEQEKQQLVDAVITQLKNEGTDVSSASVVEDVNGVSYVLCYDTNGNIVRVSPDTINQQESTNKDAIEALGKKVDDNGTDIANETKRAHDAEQALGMALQNGLNQEATARGNLAKEIKSNAMQYDTLGVYVRADKAEIYGRSIDATPRVVEFPAATTEKAGVMSAEDKKKVNASIKDIVVNPNVDDVELDLEDNTEKTSHVVFPAATTEKAGVMSAEDKKNLDALPKAIAEEVKRAKDAERVNANAIADEITRATNAEEAIKQLISDLVGTAPDTLDTLQEIAEWINKDETGTAAMVNAISTNADAIAAEQNRAKAAEKANANAIVAEQKRTEKHLTDEVEKIKGGDTIVGQAREIHSRKGKTVTDSFLVRTTAGSGTIGDGVATLKQIGGNIVKNLVDATSDNSFWGVTSFANGVFYSSPSAGGITMKPLDIIIDSHKYYIRVEVYSNNTVIMRDMLGNDNNTKATSSWHSICVLNSSPTSKNILLFERSGSNGIFMRHPLVIDLTEMFGAGNEPDKATCDKLFGTMDALPQGLTVANPTTFTSTGFNQFNPESVLEGKAIVDNAIVSGDKKIAVIPCLPCKVGVGENNGYCVHGDFGEDIKVYLTPLNPMEVDGELYMHELTKDATTDTYVPLIKGYMLVEVPTTDNLCAHFLWSEDKCERDTYEPYFESKIELPTIPEMSEWGLAGLCSAVGAKAVYDTIDLENSRYTRRIGSRKIKELRWETGIATANDVSYRYYYTPDKFMQINAKCLLEGYGKVEQEALSVRELPDLVFMAYDTGRLYLRNTAFSTIDEFLASEGEKRVFYELITPEVYPILTKAAPNYIGSDYGVEQFDSVVPCNANNLYYMRSLAGETRNFLDRLMAGLGTSDATVVADRILAVVNPAVEPANVEPETPIEE